MQGFHFFTFINVFLSFEIEKNLTRARSVSSDEFRIKISKTFLEIHLWINDDRFDRRKHHGQVSLIDRATF